MNARMHARTHAHTHTHTPTVVLSCHAQRLQGALGADFQLAEQHLGAPQGRQGGLQLGRAQQQVSPGHDHDGVLTCHGPRNTQHTHTLTHTRACIRMMMHENNNVNTVGTRTQICGKNDSLDVISRMSGSGPGSGLLGTFALEIREGIWRGGDGPDVCNGVLR